MTFGPSPMGTALFVRKILSKAARAHVADRHPLAVAHPRERVIHLYEQTDAQFRQRCQPRSRDRIYRSTCGFHLTVRHIR